MCCSSHAYCYILARTICEQFSSTSGWWGGCENNESGKRKTCRRGDSAAAKSARELPACSYKENVTLPVLRCEETFRDCFDHYCWSWSFLGNSGAFHVLFEVMNDASQKSKMDAWVVHSTLYNSYCMKAALQHVTNSMKQKQPYWIIFPRVPE